MFCPLSQIPSHTFGSRHFAGNRRLPVPNIACETRALYLCQTALSVMQYCCGQRQRRVRAENDNARRAGEEEYCLGRSFRSSREAEAALLTRCRPTGRGLRGWPARYISGPYVHHRLFMVSLLHDAVEVGRCITMFPIVPRQVQDRTISCRGHIAWLGI